MKTETEYKAEVRVPIPNDGPRRKIWVDVVYSQDLKAPYDTKRYLVVKTTSTIGEHDAIAMIIDFLNKVVMEKRL